MGISGENHVVKGMTGKRTCNSRGLVDGGCHHAHEHHVEDGVVELQVALYGQDKHPGHGLHCHHRHGACRGRMRACGCLGPQRLGEKDGGTTGRATQYLCGKKSCLHQLPYTLPVSCPSHTDPSGPLSYRDYSLKHQQPFQTSLFIKLSLLHKGTEREWPMCLRAFWPSCSQRENVWRL